MAPRDPEKNDRDDIIADARREIEDDAVEPADSTIPGEIATDVIDRYELIEELGEGGMGTVWMAKQSEPVKRRVALKIIKLGMDTREVVVRFEAERQALALMDHPHIAKVFDGGSTKQGRPYFVMELVQGIPITEYCDRVKLGLPERLRLFCQICQAIQHAHQKGIIHRDIKPSNVLVAMHDGEPVPKVIDFGIAKATSAELTQKTLFTHHAQIIGTPQYMAPEQAERGGLDIDTRADVYALGALLYEMLTGTTLFDLRKLLESGYEAILHAIREVEPDRPSTRLSTLGDAATPIATNRRRDVETLRKSLSGDLDWIVMKSLEKDRTRRYESASAFAEDVERYLRDEPVVAAPPSAAYRLRKLVSRRRKTFAAAATIAFLFIAGSIGTGVGWWKSTQANEALGKALGEKDQALIAKGQALDREEDERQRAEENERVARIAEGKATASAVRAQRELARATEVTQLITDMLANVDPALAQREDTTLLRRILGQTSQRLADGEIEDPQVAATLQTVIGKVYRTLGLHDEAETHLTAAAATRSRLPETEFHPVVETNTELAIVYLAQDRFQEAEDLLLAQLDLLERNLGDGHDSTATIQNNLGTLYATIGDFGEAFRRHSRAHEIFRETHGEEHPLTLSVRSNMATLSTRLGRFDAAEKLLLEVLETQQRVLGVNHTETVRTRHNLAHLYEIVGRIGEALPMYEAVLRINTEILGTDHPERLRTKFNLANLYARQGRFSDAEAMMRAVIDSQRRILGEDHTDTHVAMVGLALLHESQARHVEAETILRDVARRQAELLGSEHRETLLTRNNLANSLANQQRYAEAEPICLEVFEARQRVLGPEHWDTIHSMDLLARIHAGVGHTAEAEALFRKTIELRTRIVGAEHEDTVETMEFFAQFLGVQERNDEAIELQEPALEVRRRKLGDDHPKTQWALGHIVWLYNKVGRFAEAETAGIECLASTRRIFGDAHPQTLATMTNLGITYNGLGRHREAYEILRECLPGTRRAFGLTHLITNKALEGHAQASMRTGRGDEAEALFRETLQVRRFQLGPHHAETISALRNLILVLTERRSFSEAIELTREAVEAHRQFLGAENLDTQTLILNLPLLYLGLDQYEEAEAEAVKALRSLRRTSGPEGRFTLATLTNLGSIYNKMGRHDDAIEKLEISLSTKRRVFGNDNGYTREAMKELALAYAGAGRPDDAISLWREWTDLHTAEAEQPDASAATHHAAAVGLSSEHFDELRDPARALDFATRAIEIEERVGGQRLWQYHDTLATAQHLSGDSAAALESQQRAVDLTPGAPVREMVERLEAYEAAQTGER